MVVRDEGFGLRGGTIIDRRLVRIPASLGAIALLSLLLFGCEASPRKQVAVPTSSPKVVSPLSDDAIMAALDTAAPLTSDALIEDLTIIANDKGWSLDEARLYHLQSERMGRLNEKIRSARPGRLVGTRYGPEPGIGSTIYITGKADDFIRAAARSVGLPVEIVEEQTYSEDQMEARARRATELLQELGYKYPEVDSAIEEGGILEVRIGFQPDKSRSKRLVLEALPDELAEGAIITMAPDYLSRDLRRAALSKDPRSRPFGPMAVVDDSPHFIPAVGGPSGTVHIKGKCVYFQPNPTTHSQPITQLAWYAGQARWSATQDAIVFSDGRDTVTIDNGYETNIAGSENYKAKDSPWLVPPHKSCKGPVYLVWGVYQPRSR